MFSWFSKQPLVLIICTANICRSPVAAALLRSELKRRGSQKVCRVESAGISVGAPGHSPDPRMQRLAETLGVSLRGEKSVPLSARLLAETKLLVGMELRHLDAAQEMNLAAGHGSLDARLMGAWSTALADAEISDPYFSNQAAIEMVFGQLRESVAGLAEAITTGEIDLR